MDVFTLFAFGFSGLGFGLAGFTLGRVQRELRVRNEARRNLALANTRAEQRAAAIRAAAVRVTESDDDDDDDPRADTGPHRHSHDDGDTGPGSRVRETGRRAILRPDYGVSPRRHVASSIARVPDAAAVVLTRRAVDFDC